MILKSITLQNIRSYTDQYISFPEGSILLAGDIGSGKSSILQAVEFALFGARRDSVSGDALLRKGAAEGEVELRLSVDGDDVVIKRRLRRQKDSVSQESGFISINGRKREGTATELKAGVLALLNYPKDLLTKTNPLVYRYTVYTPQEEMKQIIMEGDEQRIDTLRKVFGIDRYKRIAANAATYVRQIKDGKRELQGLMQGLDEKKSELSRREEERKAAEEKMKGLIPSLEEVRRKKESAKRGLSVVEERMRHLTGLKNRSEICDARLIEIVKSRSKNTSELDTVAAAIAAVRKRLDSVFLEEKVFPDPADVEKDILDKEQRIKELSARKAELAERHRNIMERIDSLNKEISSKDERVRLAEEKESLYDEMLEKLKDKDVVERSLRDLDARLKGFERMAAELSTHKRNSQELKGKITSLDTCPTCRQLVKDFHKRNISEEEDKKIRKAEADLKRISEEKQGIASAIDEHNARLKRLSEYESRIAGMKVELVNLKLIASELENARRKHAEFDQEKLRIMEGLVKLDDKMISQLTEERDEQRALLKEMNEYSLKLKEKKHNLASLAEKEQRREELDRLQLQLKEEVKAINSEKLRLGEEISRLSHVEKEHLECRTALERILDDEKHLEVRMGEFRKEIESLGRFMLALQKDIDQKLKAEKTLDRLTRVQEWIESMFINLMGVMEREMMARVHSEFSELFVGWLDALVEDESISVRLDDSFRPLVTQNGHDIDLQHLSGGEKTSVALAYRLALNRVINDLMTNIRTRDIIMLDEPTDGFSSEQLDKVREVLDQLNVKQTIIVSHEQKIESFVDNVIRVSKTGHVSRVIS